MKHNDVILKVPVSVCCKYVILIRERQTDES